MPDGIGQPFLNIFLPLHCYLYMYTRIVFTYENIFYLVRIISLLINTHPEIILYQTVFYFFFYFTRAKILSNLVETQVLILCWKLIIYQKYQKLIKISLFSGAFPHPCFVKEMKNISVFFRPHLDIPEVESTNIYLLQNKLYLNKFVLVDYLRL